MGHVQVAVHSGTSVYERGETTTARIPDDRTAQRPLRSQKENGRPGPTTRLRLITVLTRALAIDHGANQLAVADSA